MPYRDSTQIMIYFTVSDTHTPQPPPPFNPHPTPATKNPPTDSVKFTDLPRILKALIVIMGTDWQAFPRKTFRETLSNSNECTLNGPGLRGPLQRETGRRGHGRRARHCG